MAVKCLCGAKARVRSTKLLSEQVTNLYCACSDVFCGHTFVITQSFSHSINPAKQASDGAVFELLQNMCEKDRMQLFNRFLSVPAN
ncbi:ogr/Delta-like zinc finger family protein [Dasania marina]|uniref:ogr/Delta-like zinc finger family protein n=1 Tax=Dasania marina TaxID=471499 RepID=UPI00037B7E73|nr:ogr/Delta-like zinc finger family protein [Dasania marina]